MSTGKCRVNGRHCNKRYFSSIIGKCICIHELPNKKCYRALRPCKFKKLTIKKKKKVSIMNKNIIEMYPKTEEAVLVQKWFGSTIEHNDLMPVLIKGKEAEVLKQAQKLEAEREAKIKLAKVKKDLDDEEYEE